MLIWLSKKRNDKESMICLTPKGSKIFFDNRIQRKEKSFTENDLFKKKTFLRKRPFKKKTFLRKKGVED